MITQNLASFIAHARSKGMDHQTIRMILLSAGWKEKDVSQALASESLDVPVPLPPDMGSARDAFFHLLSFTALTSTVVSLIFLFFNFLNRMLPDAAFPDYYLSDFSSIRWQLAVLFVSFPLFIWMSRVLQREYSEHQEKLASGVRRWLTYLTLFVTACTLFGDLITLIFTLLQGEITIRFLLKVVVILVLTGMPFTYYFHVLRLSPESFTRNAIHRVFLILSTAIVVLAIVWGFIIAGSPMQGRAERFDEQRISDLRTIQNEVLNIAWGNQRYAPQPAAPTPPTATPYALPKTLAEVAANANQKLQLNDPETGVPYEYRVLSPIGFELCATFALPLDNQYEIFWNHPAGHVCFATDALDAQMR